MRRTLGFALGWLATVVVAVLVALLAVTTIDDSLQGRGPLGEDLDSLPSPLSVQQQIEGLPRIKRSIQGEYGTFVVACQGAYVFGLSVAPAEGWRVVSFERGPDDDVDAVFSARGRSTELEVFCNQGEPQVEIEENELLGGDD